MGSPWQRKLDQAMKQQREEILQQVKGELIAPLEKNVDSMMSRLDSTNEGVAKILAEMTEMRKEQQSQGGQQRSGGRMACFFCNSTTHLKRDCPDHKKWL